MKNLTFYILCLSMLSVTLSSRAQEDYVKRINCGSTSPVQYEGNTFDADVSVTGEVTFDGEKTYTSSYLTLPQPIKSTRYTKNSEMHYRFNVSNGRYRARLFFAEPYHGIAPGTYPDTRKFDVDIEGQISISELNVISAAGGPDKVYILDREVMVADGELTITFSKGSGNDPLINAIEVTGIADEPVTTNDYVKRVNCGSTDEAEYNGNIFDADVNLPGEVEFDGERQGTTSYLTLPPPIKRYRFTKNSEMHYRFYVDNGNYRVILHFAEPYHGLAPGTDTATRSFNVDIEGQAFISELNIFSAGGGANKVYKMDRNVEITDGELTLTFSKGSGNDPLINAIEVIGIDLTDPEPLGKLVFVYDEAGNQIKRGPEEDTDDNNATALKAWIAYVGEEGPEREEAPSAADIFEKGITIYPNPTRGQLSLQWNPIQEAELLDIRVSDTGNRMIPVEYDSSSSTARVDLGRYPPGMYIVTFRLSDGSTVMEKILKK